MGKKYEGLLYPAHKDILAIETLSQDIDQHCEVIAFHAQQAAEKILKNVFEINGTVPPKTHSIYELLSEAIENKWLEATQQEIRASSHLSKYAVVIRYTDTPDINRGEALEAILECNMLSDMIERAGYPAIKITVSARNLADKCRDANEISKEINNGRDFDAPNKEER